MHALICRNPQAFSLSQPRTHAIIYALTNANVMTSADKANQDAAGSIRTPFKRHRYRPKLSRWRGRPTALTPESVPLRTYQRHPQKLES